MQAIHPQKKILEITSNLKGIFHFKNWNVKYFTDNLTLMPGV